MSHLPSNTRKIDPAEFPFLKEFARGYLHQDLIPEHGSALQATKAYLRDLTPKERKQAADEAFRFRSCIRNWSGAEANNAIASLGGSWSFISSDELNEVLHTLERGR